MGSLPPGRRTKAALGAYRTPSLRDIARTQPYFHHGAVSTLEAAVRYHLDGAHWTTYTDPLFVTPEGNPWRRPLHDSEVRALLLFLRSLNGDELPPVLLER
jgi:cytochrome c peroxidase